MQVAETRIDWSQELDEDNPEQLPEEMLPISGMADYEKMSRQEKAQVRRHFQAWQISQFMQGEQGALICAAKIVTQVPDIDSKFYASTQVIDEARHVESYRMLLAKFGVAYEMTPPLKALIDQVKDLAERHHDDEDDHGHGDDDHDHGNDHNHGQNH